MNARCLRGRIVVAAILVGLSVHGVAEGGDYVFTKIAEDGDGPDLTRLRGSHVAAANHHMGMNRHGEVVFTRRDKGATPTVWVGDGVTVRKVVTAKQLGAANVTGQSIDENGRVAVAALFAGQSNGEGSVIPPGGLYIVDRTGNVATISRVNGQDVGEGKPFLAPLLDGAQSIVWIQDDVERSGRIDDPMRLVRDDVQLVFDDSAFHKRDIRGRATYRIWDLSPNGNLVFSATKDDGSGSLHHLDLGGAGTATQIVDAIDAVNADASISRSGTVVFGGGPSVKQWRNGVVTSVGPGLRAVTGTAINDLEQFVYAGYPSGTKLPEEAAAAVLWDGPDSVTDRVVGPGSSLNGRAVLGVSIAGTCFNDRGQIAFLAAHPGDEGAYWRADPVALLRPAGTAASALVAGKALLKSGRLRVKGLFDSGGLPLDLTQAGSVTVNGVVVPVQAAAPKQGASTELTGDGLKLTLKTRTDGSSRGSFTLDASDAAIGAVGPDGTLDVALAMGSVTAAGQVPLAGGRYKARKSPALGPGALPMSFKAKVKKPGKHKLVAKFSAPALGDAPQTGDEFELDLGPSFGVRASGAAFDVKGVKGRFSVGSVRVDIDYAKKTVSIRAKNQELASVTTVAHTVVARLRIGAVEETVSFRVRVKGTSYSY